MLDQNEIQDLIECSHGHLKLITTTEGSKKLIVVFGPKGHFNNLFFLEKQLVELDENVLFFNSEKDNWFVESQSFLDDESVIRSAQKLEELIRSLSSNF
ncbi:hypothetical protein WMO13_07160 [Ignatzschineria larvae DSM 13226]|uniref:Uncharacterized protein n=1 Tax=Ignatzschineria larvae DSM 13226 TaxID=1111732 RepID=A0ABZ3BZD3_9GAMM|nr:hypothetical protein [Ignatzschineria larvae]